MNLFATTERSVNENMLTKASKRFLAAIAGIAASEANSFPPDDDADDPALRVLIVDDHRATTDTLFSLAAKWGYDVRRASDGVTGLKLAAVFRPDVLILDMLMPNVDGFDVAMQIRRQIGLQHCFIIALTGRADTPHHAQCYEAGVDLVLIKPVSHSDMQTLLSLESERLRQRKSIVIDDLLRRYFAGII
jgi:CheY-like chemotaxis protein